MSRTLAGQLQYAVLQSNRIGTSKYADRKAGTSKYHAHSHSTIKKRLEVAKSLGKYIQREFGVRQATDIQKEHIQSYLDACGSSGRYTPKALESTTSEARAVCRAASEAFRHFTYEGEGLKSPTPASYIPSDRDPEGMLQADYNMIRDNTPNRNLQYGLDIARMTGARAYGCVNLRGTDIQEKDGNMTVTLKEKGGASRKVDVVREEYKQVLRNYARYFGDTKLCTIKEKSLIKNLNRAMEKYPMLKEYRYAKMHAVRKLWANERYREYRQNHTKLETVQYMNQQLGHSAERDEALLARYVADIF